MDADEKIQGLQPSDDNRPVLLSVRALHVPHLITEENRDVTIAVTEEPEEMTPDSNAKAQDQITAEGLLEEIEQGQDPANPPSSDLDIVEVSSAQQEEDNRDNMTNSHGPPLKGVTTSATILFYVLPLVTIVAAMSLTVCIFTNRQRFVQFRPFTAGTSLSDFSDTQVEPSSWRSPFSTRGFLPETWNQRKYQVQSLEREASNFRFDSLEARDPT